MEHDHKAESDAAFGQVQAEAMLRGWNLPEAVADAIRDKVYRLRAVGFSWKRALESAVCFVHDHVTVHGVVPATT